MRRALLLLLLLAGPALAQPGYTVHVSVPEESRVAIRPMTPEGEPWQELEGTRIGAVRIPVPKFEYYQVRVETPGLFVTHVGEADNLEPEAPARAILLQPAVHWGRVVMAVVLLAGGAGAFLALKLRRTHARRMETMVRMVEEAESTRTLFSADGRLPGRIGPYRVRARLGTGGMAVVFKVEDEEGRPLALKVPLPHLVQDAEYMARFAREMRVGVSLNHPRVVRLEEVNPGGDGQVPYLAMELVPGRPLETTGRPVPLDKALDLASQVLAGLQYIHGHGVVHRDLKPSNVMVSSSGALKIMDFGIARREQTVGPALTKTDQTLGTPEYMAPEQIGGGQVGPWTDLYALGVMLYEQLSGVAPFQGELFEVLTKKLMDDPEPLGARRPDLAPEVVAFVEKLMARDPADRFQDAGEARAALRELRQRGR